LTTPWPTGPNDPTAATEEIHVWLTALDEPGWPGDQRLSQQERERAAGFLRVEACQRWVAARWALRGVLGRYLRQDPAAIGLDSTKRGKPRLADGGIEFNLSHSGGLALIAVANEREVGVDVERIEPARDVLALAERALPPEIAAAVHAAPANERTAAFYPAWTRHEARLKCLGVGLGGDGRGAPVTTLDLDPGPGYAAAVAFAATGESVALRCWTLPPS
jgi:4'-phosphopantetheinyl transferase